MAATRALTPEGRGADVVIEAVASPATWEWAVDMVRKGGVVNFFGGPPSGTKVQLDTNRSALRRHYFEGEFSSHSGDLPHGVWPGDQRSLQVRGVHYWTRWSWMRCRDLFARMMSQEWRLAGDQDGGLSRWGAAVSDGTWDAACAAGRSAGVPDSAGTANACRGAGVVPRAG